MTFSKASADEEPRIFVLMAGKLKHVFLIYKKVNRFTKAEYKTLEKRSLNVHSPFVFSTVSHPKDRLKLPISRKDFNKQYSNTVFIIDSIPENEFSDQPTEIKLAEIDEAPGNVEIFSIKNQNSNFEVWLNYSGNENIIGEPKRDDFYLFSFEKNKPVQIIINGEKKEIINKKPEKIYLEHVYLLEYIGEYNTVTTRKEVQYIKREIPFNRAKTINLRRLFY